MLTYWQYRGLQTLDAERWTTAQEGWFLLPFPSIGSGYLPVNNGRA